MAVSRSEIEERWLGYPLHENEVEPILECLIHDLAIGMSLGSLRVKGGQAALNY